MNHVVSFAIAVLAFGTFETVHAQATNGAVTTQSVRSADGTRIGYAKIGTGVTPLVIVHGVLDTAGSWVPVAAALAEVCTCYVMDRSGRGQSGDHATYSFDSEIDDIGALLAVAGPGAFLLGHSSGAIYTLEAARRYRLEGLVLYEPPLHYAGFEQVVAEIRSLTEAGRLEEGAALFFSAEAGLSDEGLAELRAIPTWPQIVALAPTLVREWEAIFEAAHSGERYRDLETPTLLLSGSESFVNPSFATDDLERSLPRVRKATLEGQGHEANVVAPELVADRVAEFLAAPGR